MIPKILHFIYLPGRPFSFIHFLAVYTAMKVHKPKCIYLHHTELPEGQWWEKAQPFLSLNQVEPVNEIFENPVTYPAHKADVIRMAVLKQYGGIYLDLDIISLKPFDPMLHHEFVMGMEPGTGLCNAVILSTQDAPFLHQWHAQYRTFDSRKWNYHSVVLPWELARKHPEQIHVEDKYAFFYPSHNDPVHRYLWGKKPSMLALAIRMGKNLIKLPLHILSGRKDAMKLAFYATFHGLHGSEWHYRRAQQSYCLHLWEGLWGEPYLKAITPEYLRKDISHFARLMRVILTDDELRQMDQHKPLQCSP